MKPVLEKYRGNCVLGVLIFQNRIIIITYIVNISSTKVMIRTTVFFHGYQRGRTQAESLLARIECLPPLNFSGERF